MVKQNADIESRTAAMAKINFTPDALEDMREIKAYITDELCSEQSAINTIEKIMKRIRLFLQLRDFFLRLLLMEDAKFCRLHRCV